METDPKPMRCEEQITHMGNLFPLYGVNTTTEERTKELDNGDLPNDPSFLLGLPKL